MRYTWKLTGLKKLDDPSIELDDVIVQTYWEVKGKNSDGEEGVFSGATPLPPETADPENFTAYADLTEKQVLGWIKAIVKDGPENYWDRICETIDKQIYDRKISNEIEGDALPWNTQENDTP